MPSRQIVSCKLDPRHSHDTLLMSQVKIVSVRMVESHHACYQEDETFLNRLNPEHHPSSLLLRCFVFRMAEASAKRVTGDTPQGTMGRVQTAGEAPARSCVLPAFLCAHIFIKRETSGYEAATHLCAKFREPLTPRDNKRGQHF